MHTTHCTRFEFADKHSASLAWGLLTELGYAPGKAGSRQVHIQLQHGDLVSALEIVMAHGGRLMEQESGDEAELADTAYELDVIPIPAHIVNEDWMITEAELSSHSGELEV
ncbi:hypothetical protein [Paenibacillus pinihumi]|uniref:hypothetical protein n=1 Tax=Paenibacillus pinihumi TaxID=669462 RepID=UPI000404F10D|nr:hypothetical protein [Paenibacillus pinihumi]